MKSDVCRTEKVHAISVGSRCSPLAQVQVKEILSELKLFHPDTTFDITFLKSTGDIDQKTSLRTLDKTNFFTKEIDEMLLSGQCRIGIHSAKDLPDPIPKGLKVVAITRGLDPSDSLVLRHGESLESLPPGAIIATSSERREEAVRKLRPDFTFIDLRGTIAERLMLLDRNEADGVVVAEAALIRLGLENTNRIKLPGETTKMQGQLAVLAREGDLEMGALFACIDSRPKIWYTGLEVPPEYSMGNVIHGPLISIKPRQKDDTSIKKVFDAMEKYTHIIFTSKVGVSLFFARASDYGVSEEEIRDKVVFAVGESTAARIRSFGIDPAGVALNETAEGLVELLCKCDLRGKSACLLWPHAAKSRSVISDWLTSQCIDFDECILYDTLSRRPLEGIDLDHIDEIVFTSPSTVEAFKEFFGDLPKNKKLTSIGPITERAIRF